MQNFILLFLGLFLLSALSLYVSGVKPVTGDDTWGVTAVLGNPLEVIIFTLRWDVHPPLYYLFLDLWAMIDKSDLWLRLSSSFLHALTTATAFTYVQRRNGWAAAFVTLVIVFTSPLLLEYSTSIRMYSFIAFLSISIFCFIEKMLVDDERKYFKWILILGFVLLNSHVIGILFVFFHFCYGSLKIYQNKSRFVEWIIGHAGLAILALPAIANGMLKSVNHASAPSFEQVLGFYKTVFMSGHGVYLLVSLFFTVLMLRDKSVRHIAVCYLIWPIIFFAAISYFLKPMWLERNFVFALPMLGVAAGISFTKIKFPRALKVVLLLAFAGVNIMNSHMFKRYDSSNSSFQQMLNTVEENSNIEGLKTCIISTETLHTFWSLQRYLNAVEWGSPVEIQHPINERWQQVAAKLPESLKQLLKLYPHPNFSETENLIIVSRHADRCFKPDVSKVLIISDQKDDGDYKLLLQNSKYKIFEKSNNGK